MIKDNIYEKTVVVYCDDCLYSTPVIGPILYEDLIEGKYHWHPRHFIKRMPNKLEIDEHARSYGIQHFRRGRARRRHLLDSPAHLCNYCRVKRLYDYYDRGTFKKIIDVLRRWCNR